MAIIIALSMAMAFTLTASDESTKVSIIFDTDMGNDCDDAGALAILHALADKGEAEILGVICSSGANPYGPGTVDAINTYYGRPHLPIGSEQGDFGDPSQKYTQQVGTNTALFGHDVVDKTDVPAALTVYRQLLAAAPDHSVTIVTVGHLKGLHDLLFSEADDASPLTGLALVQKKVKEWVCMGGYYPSGGEFNLVKMGANAYTKNVVDAWPVKVVFSGAEIGNAYRTGSKLADLPANNPVRECYYQWANFYNSSWPFSRRSWDQTAVLYAVRGLSTYWNAQTTGYNSISTSGYNTWQRSPDKDHNALINISGSGVGTIIENLMIQEPQNVPQASFTKSVNGLTVEVNGTNSNTPSGSFASYTWNWGDGNTDTGITASHTYSETGIYNITLTVTNDQGQTASQTSTITAHDGIALNESNPLLNLALAADVTLSGNAGIDGRGELNHILYDPSIGDYVVKSDWAEYGVASQANLGKVGIDDAFYWMAEWEAPKYINYITFGGCYPNQPQTNSLWQVEFRFENQWETLASGKGGWLNDDIFSWGGENQTPITADAIRVRIYSDGSNDLVSIHLCGRGGISYKDNDSGTTIKASMIQFIGDHQPTEEQPDPTPSTPIAAFSNTLNGLTVAVDATSSTTPSGTISSYAWNWGDGNTSTGATASHTYGQAGNYTITLTVTNSEGGLANQSLAITANNDASPFNSRNSLVNLALTEDATLSGNAGSDGRGDLNHILYDPAIGNYVVKSDWNEYGEAHGTNLGTHRCPGFSS